MFIENPNHASQNVTVIHSHGGISQCEDKKKILWIALFDITSQRERFSKTAGTTPYVDIKLHDSTRAMASLFRPADSALHKLVNES